MDLASVDLLLKKLIGFFILIVDARIAVFDTTLEVVLDFPDIIWHDPLNYVKGELAWFHTLSGFFKRNGLI